MQAIPNMLQHTATHCNTMPHTMPHTATHCITLHQTVHMEAMPNTLQLTATSCSILQHPAASCNTLQHTATHCNTLHQTVHMQAMPNTLQLTATYCNTLQHTATHCITLHQTVHMQAMPTQAERLHKQFEGKKENLVDKVRAEYMSLIHVHDSFMDTTRACIELLHRCAPTLRVRIRISSRRFLVSKRRILLRARYAACQNIPCHLSLTIM